MLEAFALICLFAAPIILVVLSIIDLKIGLLPNIYNAAFAALGLLFHTLTSFEFMSATDIVLGTLVGGGLLWTIRFVANHIYKQDALGLGDVKLLGAAGIWLGPHMVMIALVVGALAGIVHGGIVIAYNKLQSKDKKSIGLLSHFSIPAGPGFAFGIFAAGAWFFVPFLERFFT